jgi:hypothetical protein
MYTIQGGTVSAACMCIALIGSQQPGDIVMAGMPWIVGVAMFGSSVCHFLRLRYREWTR